MRNRFTSTCARCGQPVAPGFGSLDMLEFAVRSKAGGTVIRRWVAQHDDCANAYHGTQVGLSEPRGKRPQQQQSKDAAQ